MRGDTKGSVVARAPSGEPPLPAHRKKAGRSFFGWVPSLAGKVGLGLATTGVILGTIIGIQGPFPTSPSPAPITAKEPVGSEISHVANVLEQTSKIVFPAEFDRSSLIRTLDMSWISARVERGHLVAEGGLRGLEIPAGTRLSASLNPYALTFQASPNLHWRVDGRPDPEIRSLSYNFREGSFYADASGIGLDSWYENGVIQNANAHLKPRLAPAMRESRYNPMRDPELVRNLQIAFDNLTPTRDPSTSETRLLDFSQLSDVSIGFRLKMPETCAFPLGSNGQYLEVPKDCSISVTISTKGAANAPVLDFLRIHFSKPAAINEKGRPSRSFSKIDVQEIKIGAGGNIDLKYSLGAEQLVDGLRGLFLLSVAIADPRILAYSGGSYTPSQMEEARAQVREHVETKIEPAFREFIRRQSEQPEWPWLNRFFGVEKREA